MTIYSPPTPISQTALTFVDGYYFVRITSFIIIIIIIIIIINNIFFWLLPQTNK